MATIDFSEPFDVVVAGGGNAALCAAITAARAGARVMVVEGAPAFYRGGNTRHTRNLRLAHDGSAPTMTGPYTPEEFLDDLYRVTGGETDEAARQAHHRAFERIDRLAERTGRALPAAAQRHAQPGQNQRLLPRRRARRPQRALPPGRGARRLLPLRDAGHRAHHRGRPFHVGGGAAPRPRAQPCAAARSSPPAAASRPISNG